MLESRGPRRRSVIINSSPGCTDAVATPKTASTYPKYRNHRPLNCTNPSLNTTSSTCPCTSLTLVGCSTGLSSLATRGPSGASPGSISICPVLYCAALHISPESRRHAIVELQPQAIAGLDRRRRGHSQTFSLGAKGGCSYITCQCSRSDALAK
jgi:hypothetical protein